MGDDGHAFVLGEDGIPQYLDAHEEAAEEEGRGGGGDAGGGALPNAAQDGGAEGGVGGADRKPRDAGPRVHFAEETEERRA